MREQPVGIILLVDTYTMREREEEVNHHMALNSRL